MNDLLWMRQNGIEAAVKKLASSGTPVLGVCGGYQMMGWELSDPQRIEGRSEYVRGMELLPVRTVFDSNKTRTRYRAQVKAEPFRGAELDGYEIHMGKTTVQGEPFCVFDDGRADGCCRGNAFGTYLHGLFDTGELTEKLAEYLCGRKGIDYCRAEPVSRTSYVQQQYDILAESVRKALDMERIYDIMDRYYYSGKVSGNGGVR